ncbi:MAG TPA: glutathione S-transferase family protein [Candidatus Nanopelagicales bacterium]|nr:glutathione S-transferase family protein [Candidatus Nanopelagicales bacterium]
MTAAVDFAYNPRGIYNARGRSIMSITFYYAPQSNASRIRWSLAELGVPHDTVQVDLRAGDQKKPEFLALNPNGKVPTLVIDGTPVFESVAIQIALGERYGVEKGLWPAPDSPERLTALTWLLWGQVSLGAAIFRYMMNTSEWVPAEQHNAKQAEAAMTDVRSLLHILDARLDGRPYLTGSTFTLADLDICSVLGWGLHVIKVDISDLPNLQAWLSRVNGRPAAREATAET